MQTVFKGELYRSKSTGRFYLHTTAFGMIMWNGKNWRYPLFVVGDELILVGTNYASR
jgi:hypothetical protein